MFFLATAHIEILLFQKRMFCLSFFYKIVLGIFTRHKFDNKNVFIEFEFLFINNG